jgi:predicted Fe-Mo cluster-binding NifX family protein
MRIAIPEWQGRIAPVFDVAGHLLLVDVEGGREVHREDKRLVKADVPGREAELLSFGTNVLICGAISAPLQSRIDARGIRVIAFICGTVDEVLTAYLNGTLYEVTFSMPGCRRRRWRGGPKVLRR